ncbi:hypothetical protein T484DRAFT_1945852 [Baffinella frigidus]|nr:hypothetical protein T484DRAFT_1945852 [Cryptophyta sp. CCMP2293]
MDGRYTLPAGHVDPGERILQAKAREAREEIGVTILEANTWISSARLAAGRARFPAPSHTRGGGFDHFGI